MEYCSVYSEPNTRFFTFPKYCEASKIVSSDSVTFFFLLHPWQELRLSSVLWVQRTGPHVSIIDEGVVTGLCFPMSQLCQQTGPATYKVGPSRECFSPTWSCSSLQATTTQWPNQTQCKAAPVNFNQLFIYVTFTGVFYLPGVFISTSSPSPSSLSCSFPLPLLLFLLFSAQEMWLYHLVPLLILLSKRLC